MSWPTSPPTSSSGPRELDRWLGESERTIALLERCLPQNSTGEREQLERTWRRGERAEPAFSYRPAPRLGPLRRALDQLAETLERGDPVDRLYAGRARELSLEAWIAEAVGSPELGRRAELRFGVRPGPDARRAEAWAREWTCDPPAPRPGPRVASDDRRHPMSLASALERAIARRRLPLRVLVRDDLLAAAATGQGVIAVRGRVAYTASEVERIVTHEVEGHALPRWRAEQHTLGLLRVGSAGGSDDEEGRALLLERRHGQADRARRAELGWRHLGGLAVRRGANFVELVELLLALGAPLRAALEVAIRCQRGGGLGREVVYLVACSRLERELGREPELEAWLEQGRVSIAAARVLDRLLGSPLLQANPGCAPGGGTRWVSSLSAPGTAG